MRKLILRMSTTVDGVVAPEEEQKVFDFEDDGLWADHFEMLKSVDTMLIGSGMHKDYLGHWNKQRTNPQASENERRFGELASKIPHFVLSRTMKSVDFPNAEVLKGGVDGIAELKQKPGKDIVLWGGVRAAAAAIEAGVVDEYHLNSHPAIAGRGKKLFEKVEHLRLLKPLEAKTLPSGIVMLKYGSR